MALPADKLSPVLSQDGDAVKWSVLFAHGLQSRRLEDKLPSAFELRQRSSDCIAAAAKENRMYKRPAIFHTIPICKWA